MKREESDTAVSEAMWAARHGRRKHQVETTSAAFIDLVEAIEGSFRRGHQQASRKAKEGKAAKKTPAGA